MFGRRGAFAQRATGRPAYRTAVIRATRRRAAAIKPEQLVIVAVCPMSGKTRQRTEQKRAVDRCAASGLPQAFTFVTGAVRRSGFRPRTGRDDDAIGADACVGAESATAVMCVIETVAAVSALLLPAPVVWPWHFNRLWGLEATSICLSLPRAVGVLPLFQFPHQRCPQLLDGVY